MTRRAKLVGLGGLVVVAVAVGAATGVIPVRAAVRIGGATAVAMVDATARYYPQFGDRVASVVLGAVLILELTAPLATQIALRAASEARAGADWR